MNQIANHELFKSSSLYEVFHKKPLSFVDIGARGGAHEVVEAFAELTSVVAFEPDKQECQRLSELSTVTDPWANFTLLPVALSDQIGEQDLHLLSAPTNHSLRAPNTHLTARYNMVKWVELGKTKVPCSTLDAEQDAGRLPEPEFIKIDTQGTEFEILSSAAKSLSSSVVAVVAEVSFAELYKGQKLFSEIEALLRPFGFQFYGFSGMFNRSQHLLDKTKHPSKERAFYADAIFFKDPLENPTVLSSFSERNAHALFICAVLLGYYDFALELAEQTFLTGEMCTEERERLYELIRSLSVKDPETEIQKLEQLLSEAKANPDFANALIGRFIDQRREACDYHDVFNTLATPPSK